MRLRDKSANFSSEMPSGTPAQDFPHEEVCAQMSLVGEVWTYMKSLLGVNVSPARAVAYSSLVQTAWRGRQALENAGDLRNNKDVAELLALLWENDLTTLLIARLGLARLALFGGLTLRLDLMQTPFESEALRIIHAPPARLRSTLQAHYVQELSAFIQRECPHCPESPEQRYQAVVTGLRAALRHNMEELRLSDELFTVDYLNDSLQICRALRAVETHDVCCDLLTAARYTIFLERSDGPRTPPLENLRREIYAFLAALPPEQSPTLWQRLSDPATSSDFWPVVNAIRSPDAVPYLLDALPNLGDNGKAVVIAALQNLGDMRAVPALRRMAQDKTSPSAPIAESALAHILRNSRSDAAQLLRPTDAGSGDQAGDALLRPATPLPNSSRPHEMLRADTTSVKKPNGGKEVEN